MYNSANVHFVFFIWTILPQVIELIVKWKTKALLETELEKIGVRFKFYEVQCEDGPSQTQCTRLDGIYKISKESSCSLKVMFPHPWH